MAQQGPTMGAAVGFATDDDICPHCGQPTRQLEIVEYPLAAGAAPITYRLVDIATGDHQTVRWAISPEWDRWRP